MILEAWETVRRVPICFIHSQMLESEGFLKIINRAAGRANYWCSSVSCLWHELMLYCFPSVFIKKQHCFPLNSVVGDSLILSEWVNVYGRLYGQGLLFNWDTSITDWESLTFCNMQLWALLFDFLRRISSSWSLGTYLDYCFGVLRNWKTQSVGIEIW